MVLLNLHLHENGPKQHVMHFFRSDMRRKLKEELTTEEKRAHIDQDREIQRVKQRSDDEKNSLLDAFKYHFLEFSLLRYSDWQLIEKLLVLLCLYWKNERILRATILKHPLPAEIFLYCWFAYFFLRLNWFDSFTQLVFFERKLDF